jgi:hypothetical protein
MDKEFRSFGLLRAANESALTVEAIISTGNMARDDAIISPDGWDFRNYAANPVVLFNHNDFNGFAPARTIAGPTAESDDTLRATALFDAEDEDAVKLFGKIERGFLNATSVRWLPKRWEFRTIPDDKGKDRDVLVFLEQELLEWSFVNIPSDTGAKILRANGDPIDLAEFQVENGVPLVAAPPTTIYYPLTADDRTTELLERLNTEGFDAVLSVLTDAEYALFEGLRFDPAKDETLTPRLDLSKLAGVVTQIEGLSERRANRKSAADLAKAAIASATGHAS